MDKRQIEGAVIAGREKARKYREKAMNKINEPVVKRQIAQFWQGLSPEIKAQIPPDQVEEMNKLYGG